MPNWAENNLKLTHADPEFIKRAADGFRGEGFLSAFMPVPQALRDTVAGSFSDPVEQAAQLEKEKANIAAYGYKNWYDWSVANWGTKWDISGEEAAVSEDGLSLTVYFQSAWSPPIEAYSVLEEKFGFTIDAHFYEGGMGFYGEYSDGAESTVNFSSFKDIPDNYIDMFGLEDWEEEEDEEESVKE